MKISSFRIRNFRSLIDSGWKSLANDNITVLIGQNESGKTTVLEALHSFYTGNINEDVLRSDLSMPEISCEFKFTGEQIDQMIQLEKLPEEIRDTFKNSCTIKLARVWDDLYTNRMIVDEQVINEHFKEHQKKKANDIQETKKKLTNITQDFENTKARYNELFMRKNELDNQLNELENDINSKKRQLNKTKKEPKKQQYNTELKELQEQYKSTKEKQQNLSKEFDELTRRINTEEETYQISIKSAQIQEEYNNLTKEAESIYEELREAESALGIITNEKERKATLTKLENIKNKYVETTSKISEKSKEYEFWIMVAEKVIEGEKQEKAKKDVTEYQQKQDQYYTPEELGAIFFKEIPVFEFFHDFSSLLPDKIDLEDIIFKREDVKGYKAVRNYLKIADLKPEFFDQKNSRILKQKIEKLNHEITVDFHEYWRQSVGKDNKINISFELEHYDHNTPEKIGKPYIEFWIKDKDERLYPKQRSKGVRWFLSFYLELKAYAMDNQDNRVLLIDEPAMSLHARAQEDVLKVFEDIKKYLQVIYTTHSPHLINENKLYRVLAIQRAKENYYSESIIYEPGSLKTASSDTLSPIYVLMGSQLNAQEFIQKENNVILEDLSTYFYFMAMSKMAGLRKNLHFIPATNTNNVATMANILLGWKLGFVIVLGNSEASQEVYEYFKDNLFQNDEKLTQENILRLPSGGKTIEDVFSTLDFKKYILNQRKGITEANSNYIEHNNLSRSMLAASFLSKVQNEHLTLKDFDEETNENLQELLNGLFDILKTETANQLYP
jgi:predicted ATP-dependent endonuclease of OLD family